MLKTEVFGDSPQGAFGDWQAKQAPDGYAQRLLNCHWENGTIRPRPGTVPAAVQAGGQFDSTSPAVCLARGVKADGTVIMVMIDTAGVATIYNTALRTQSTYDINTGLSITLGSGLCDWTALYDQLVFTNGSNNPFMYDVENDSWTLLSDAPIAKSVTTYYQKIVFGNIVEAGKENRLEWSEEGQPAVGYDAGSYDNFWVFGQIDPGPIVGVVGMNEALYVFKRGSIASVRGPTEDAFTTSGTREDISGTTGLYGPLAVAVVNEDIYFMDPFFKAMRMRGGRVEHISEIPETGTDFLRDWRTENVINAWNLSDRKVFCWYDTVRKHVHFYVDDEYGPGTSGARVSAVFNTENGFWHEEQVHYTVFGTEYFLECKPCTFFEGTGYTGTQFQAGYAKVVDKTTEWEVLWADSDRQADDTNVPFPCYIQTRNYAREWPSGRVRFLTFNLLWEWQANESGQVADMSVSYYTDKATRPAVGTGTQIYGVTPTNSTTREGLNWKRAGLDIYGHQVAFEIYWASNRDIFGIHQWQGAFVALDAMDDLSF